MEFFPHSNKQDAALFFPTPIGIVVSGIQWGKTSVGAMWMKMKNHTFTEPGDNFLITSPTYKILQQSTLPPYLRYMDGYGEYKKADAVFEIYGGGKVYFRTGTDPDSIVGITDVRAILADELGLYSLYFWENIMARAAFKSAQVLGVTSPYSMGWLYKDIIRPRSKNKDARPDVTLITARSDENPYFPKDVYERQKKTMDPRRFNMVFGGQFDRMAGLVYDCFDEQESVCAAIQLPEGTRYFGGIDWGYTEPFALSIRAVTPSGQHYKVAEVYKSGLTITEIIDICRQKKLVFGVETFFCDPSQPGYIEEMRRHKLNAVGANNDIKVGIGRHYELIKTRRLKFFKDCTPHTLDEIETYHYPDPEDLGPDDKAKDQNPVGQNDHAMDSDRYLTVELFHQTSVKIQPKVAEEKKIESNYDRLQKLKRPSGSGPRTENWS